MIGFSPALVLPYIPASQKLAKAYLQVLRDEGNGITRATLFLLDEAGDRISPNAKAMPNGGKIPQASIDAIATGTDGLAGDTIDRCASRNYLALVQVALGVGVGVGVVL